MNLITIRSLEINDLPNIIEIENATQISPWSPDVFSRCIESGYQGWVIEQNNAIVGFVVAAFQAGECHILNVGVSPAFQRQGHGQRLLVQVIEAAIERKIYMIFLEVRKSNHGAIALYHKMGFCQTGERKAYYSAVNGREDALLFAMDLQTI